MAAASFGTDFRAASNSWTASGFLPEFNAVTPASMSRVYSTRFMADVSLATIRRAVSYARSASPNLSSFSRAAPASIHCSNAFGRETGGAGFGGGAGGGGDGAFVTGGRGGMLATGLAASCACLRRRVASASLGSNFKASAKDFWASSNRRAASAVCPCVISREYASRRCWSCCWRRWASASRAA